MVYSGYYGEIMDYTDCTEEQAYSAYLQLVNLPNWGEVAAYVLAELEKGISKDIMAEYVESLKTYNGKTNCNYKI